jgi:hypothetical protein
MAQLSQAPPEHVDVDRGACEESGAKWQFSEHMQGETHVPTVAGICTLEWLTFDYFKSSCCLLAWWSSQPARMWPMHLHAL